MRILVTGHRGHVGAPVAALLAGLARVVHFSSAQVFGTAGGERQPDYFPIGDAHPRRAMRAYGLSKCLAEDLCAGFTSSVPGSSPNVPLADMAPETRPAASAIRTSL